MHPFSSATLGAIIGGGVGVAATLAVGAWVEAQGAAPPGVGVVVVGAGTLLVPLLAAVGLTVGVMRLRDGRPGPVAPDKTGHERP